MRKSKLFKGLLLVLGAVCMVAVALFAESLADLFPLVSYGALVGATVDGGILTEQQVREKEPDLDREDISKKVIELLPARTALDTIMRHNKDVEKIGSMIKKFYSVSSKPLYDAIDGTEAAFASITTPASSYTLPTTGSGHTSMTLAVTNDNLWAADDTFMMRGVPLPISMVIGGTGTIYEDVVFYVDSVSSGSMVIKPLNGLKNSTGDFVIPGFESTAVLYRLGNAKNELAMQTPPFGLIPQPDENYCQFFMAQVEESIFQRMTEMEVDWRFTDIEKQNLYAMKAEMEMSFLWGVKRKNDVKSTSQNNYRYTTGGIIREITTNLQYGLGGADRSISVDDYLNWMETVFVGNNGSTERVVFGGSTFMKGLHKVEDIKKQLDAKSTEVKYGIEFNKIITNFGTLLLYHHPLLSYMGAKDMGLVLDMAHVHKHEFFPMQVTNLDLQKSGQRRVDARVIAEASCLTLSFPDCHAIIRPKA